MRPFLFKCDSGHLFERWLPDHTEANKGVSCQCGRRASRRWSASFAIKIQEPYFHPALGKVIRNRDEKKAALAELEQRFNSPVEEIPDIDYYVKGDDRFSLKGYGGVEIDRSDYGLPPRYTPGYGPSDTPPDELSGDV